MKIHFCHSILLGIALVTLSLSASAAPKQKRIVWRERSDSQTGLYGTKNFFVTHGVSLTLGGMYYFGDVDNEGLSMNGGFNVKNLSLGGGLRFAYQMPVGNHCNLHFSLMGGTLRGDNENQFKALAEPRDDYRKFNSVVIQPSVSIQYYPFSRAGFYIYGGLALTASIITDYQFYYYKRVGGGKVRTPLRGKTFGFLPMVRLGLGYSWKLTDSWLMSAEIGVDEGLIDTHYMNLDAWPLAPSQNSDEVALGNSFGTWVGRNGQKHIHWNDGWFQVGITVTYRWSNCEHCRIINNYGNRIRK